MKTLNEFYDHASEYGNKRSGASQPPDSVSVGGDAASEPDSAGHWDRMCANEAEFRAYYALSQLYNPAEVQRYLSRLSADVIKQPPIQFVLKVIIGTI